MKSLIVVDLQKGLMTNSIYVELCKKIETYIKKNKKKYSKIFFTKFINDKNSLYETKLKWTNLQSEDSQEFMIKLPDNAIIMQKHGYGLSQDDLEKIKMTGEVDICGIQTDACVYAIALQLWDAGIFPNVLINYCATSPDKLEFAKNILIHQFGSVDKTE